MRRLAPALLVALLLAGCGSSAKPPDLVFVSTRDGDYALFGIDANGKHERRLTKEKGDPTTPAGLFFQVEPAWSPDGQRIAFGREGALFVVPAAGGPAKRIGHGFGNAADPAWSPDGKLIAYDYRRPGFSIRELWVMRADGTRPRGLTKLQQVSARPAWSPDGRRIAFESNVRGGHYEIYSIGLDGTGLRQLTRSRIDTIDPAWAPGADLAFSRDGAIWVLDAAGRARQLTKGENDASPAWRPPG